MVLICSQVTRVLHPRNIIRPTLSILPTEHHLTHVKSPVITLQHLKNKLFSIILNFCSERERRTCVYVFFFKVGLTWLKMYKYVFDDFSCKQVFWN